MKDKSSSTIEKQTMSELSRVAQNTRYIGRNGEYATFQDIKQIESIVCIYGLKSPSGKWYIGQTLNLYDRMRRHRYNLAKNISNCPKLQNAINKYKLNNFEIHVLKRYKTKCSRYLINMEIKYIQQYDSINNGYNSILDSGQSRNYKLSAEQIEKRRLQSLKSVIKLSLKGEFISKYESVTDAARSINDQSTNVSEACKSWRNNKSNKQRKGYLFIYSQDYHKNRKYSYKPHKMSKSHKLKLKLANQSNSRTRECWLIEDNDRKYFKSLSELERHLNMKQGRLQSAIFISTGKCTGYKVLNEHCIICDGYRIEISRSKVA